MELKEVKCGRCGEIFSPDIEYEFPTRIVYWHECPDGSMTSISKERPKKEWDFFKKPEALTAKEVIARRMKKVHSLKWTKPVDVDNEQQHLGGY